MIPLNANVGVLFDDGDGGRGGASRFLTHKSSVLVRSLILLLCFSFLFLKNYFCYFVVICSLRELA